MTLSNLDYCVELQYYYIIMNCVKNKRSNSTNLAGSVILLFSAVILKLTKFNLQLNLAFWMLCISWSLINISSV